jgi:hypothetical protein
MSGAIAALILFAAACVFFAFRYNTAPDTASVPDVLTGPPVATKPMVVRPPRTAAPPQRSPGSETPPEGGRPYAPSPPAASTYAGDAPLRAAIQRGLPAGLSLAAVQTDPRTAQVVLDVAVPAGPLPEIRERVLRAAAHAARAAAAADPRFARVTSRVTLRVEPAEPGSPGTPPTPTLAFIGDAAAADVRSLNPDLATAEQILSLFINPWWSPALEPAPAAAP